MLPPLSPCRMSATPSIVMLLEFGHWPRPVNPLHLRGRAAHVRAAVARLRHAPGTSVARNREGAPSLAMFLSASRLEDEAIFALVVCSSLTRAVTLICSVMAPTSSTIVGTAGVVRLTITFVRSTVLKPSATGLQGIGVGSSNGGRMNRPSAMVVVVTAFPRLARQRHCRPGSTAPWVSVDNTEQRTRWSSAPGQAGAAAKPGP